jgi:hypothetical protein
MLGHTFVSILQLGVQRVASRRECFNVPKEIADELSPTDFDSFVLEEFRSSDTLNISNVKRSLARHQQLP